MHIPSKKKKKKKRRHSTTVISARNDGSIECSPLHRVVLILPVHSLACSARVDNHHRQNGELIWRVRKPPDATGHRPLIEAVNKMEKGGRRGHSPVARPTSAPLACLPIPWPTFASFACCHSHVAFASVGSRYIHEAFIITRANGKG